MTQAHCTAKPSASHCRCFQQEILFLQPDSRVLLVRRCSAAPSRCLCWAPERSRSRTVAGPTQEDPTEHREILLEDTAHGRGTQIHTHALHQLFCRHLVLRPTPPVTGHRGFPTQPKRRVAESQHKRRQAPQLPPLSPSSWVAISGTAAAAGRASKARALPALLTSRAPHLGSPAPSLTLLPKRSPRTPCYPKIDGIPLSSAAPGCVSCLERRSNAEHALTDLPLLHSLRDTAPYHVRGKTEMPQDQAWCWALILEKYLKEQKA